MKNVYFKSNGRFANNLFQYFAAELIKKVYNFDTVCIYNNETNIVTIDDALFIRIMNQYINTNTIYSIETDKCFLLDGYFQRSEIFKPMRHFIKSLFNSDNHCYFNNMYKISDVVNHKYQNFEIKENDLVMHLRLNDFIGHPCQIFKPEDLLKIINHIKYDRLFIVCDKILYNWEFQYIENFKHLNPIFINGSLLDDFHLMMQSKRILISASTLSWMAVFLSDLTDREIYIPYNNRHGGYFGTGQHLSDFSNECVIIHGLSTIK